jgi:lipopolysaccharide transport system permease protein
MTPQGLTIPLRDGFASLVRHRRLLLRLAGREIASRWRGSMLGPLWALAVPLSLLAIYTFVFSSVLGSRWSRFGDADHQPPFALVLFAGLLLFNAFAETILASPNVVRNNATFVRQIVFPVEILPAVALLGALFNAAVAALVLLVAYLVVLGPPPASALWLPIVVLPLPILALGCAWILAGLGAYLRDLAQAVSVLATMLLFLSPVFYSLDAVPQEYRIFIAWNPIGAVVTEARSVLFAGSAPNPWALLATWFAALAVFEIGFHLFRRAKEGFADVV